MEKEEWEMTKERELAADIIDEIIEAILEANPEIDTEKKQGNTLLYGGPYYALEDSITEQLEHLKERFQKMKNLDDNEDDISALFESILSRINEKRAEHDKIVIQDREKREAIVAYVKEHPDDHIVWGGD